MSSLFSKLHYFSIFSVSLALLIIITLFNLTTQKIVFAGHPNYPYHKDLICPDNTVQAGTPYQDYCQNPWGTSPNECWANLDCSVAEGSPAIDCRDQANNLPNGRNYCSGLSPSGGDFYCNNGQVLCDNSNGACYSNYPACTPTADLQVNNSNGPITVADGSSILLSWTSTNAGSCTGTWGDNPTKVAQKQWPDGDTRTNLPGPATYAYYLQCSNNTTPSDPDFVTVNVDAPLSCTTSFFNQCGGTCNNQSYASDHYLTVTRTTCSDNSSTESCTDNGRTAGQCGVSISEPSCSPLSTSTVDPAVSSGTCQSGQYCVQIGPTYQNMASPIYQAWDFGDTTSGINSSTQTTYHGYNQTAGSQQATISLSAKENSGNGPQTASCNKQIEIPASGTTSTTTSTTTSPTCGTCSASEPACDQTTTGTCSNSGATCTKTGGNCGDNLTFSLRFFNQDCTTPYSSSANIGVLRNYQWGDGHNPFYYWEGWGPCGGWGCSKDPDKGNMCRLGDYLPAKNKNCSTNTNTGGACHLSGYHPWSDPATSLDTRYLTTPAAASTCLTSGGGSGNASTCGIFYGCADTNHCAAGATDPVSAFPRCFAAASSQTNIISALNPMWREIRGPLGSGDQQILPRNQQTALSIGSPTGYQLKVIAVCKEGYCPDYNTRYLNPSQYPDGGSVVKDFNSPFLGYTNYWASPFEKPDGNSTTLAYDVCIKPPLYTISGIVWIDQNNNSSYDSGIDTIYSSQNQQIIKLTGNALSSPLLTSTTSQGYVFGDNTSTLIPGTYEITLTEMPATYRALTPRYTTVYLTANTTVNFGLTQNPDPWFQTRGDVHSNIRISNPGGPTTFAQTAACSSAIIAKFQDGLISAPELAGLTIDQISACAQHPRTAFAPYKIPIFDDLKSLYFTRAKSTVAKIEISSSPSQSNFDSAFQNNDIVLISNGNLNFNKDDNLGSPKPTIVFVEGNLAINDNITYGNAHSGIIFVIRGNVDININVTRIDAVIISSGTICTAYNPAVGACQSGNIPSEQLTVNGSLIALNESAPISFGRFLENNEEPAEIINNQVKYLVILRNLFSDTYHKWSEIDASTILPVP